MDPDNIYLAIDLNRHKEDILGFLKEYDAAEGRGGKITGDFNVKLYTLSDPNTQLRPVVFLSQERNNISAISTSMAIVALLRKRVEEIDNHMRSL